MFDAADTGQRISREEYQVCEPLLRHALLEA